MNNYELLYILPANITSEEIKVAFLEIENNILKLGGKKFETLLDHPFLAKAKTSKEEEVEELKNLPIIKRRLAYPIKKNKVAFYCLFNFSSEPSKLRGIDTYLRMNNVVVRHLIIQANPITKDEIQLLEKLFARKRAEQEKQEREKKDKSKTKEKKNKKEETAVFKKRESKPNDEKIKEVGETKKEEETKDKKTTAKKKKIKLEDLEDKLDKILKDTSMI